jgi:uncharacterized coiled-coil DUF342 family protein
MLATLLSIFLLSNPSIDTILENQLNTPEGRTEFLTEKLSPFVQKADQLNQEVTALTQQVAEAEQFNAEIAQIADEVTKKMGELSELLPILNLALHVDSDFQQIDTLLESKNLTFDQQQVADRIASLCKSVN